MKVKLLIEALLNSRTPWIEEKLIEVPDDISPFRLDQMAMDFAHETFGIEYTWKEID